MLDSILRGRTPAQPNPVDLLTAPLRQPRHLPPLRPTLHDSSTPPRRTRSRCDTRTADDVLWTDTIATTTAATLSTEPETTGDLDLPDIPDSATQTDRSSPSVSINERRPVHRVTTSNTITQDGPLWVGGSYRCPTCIRELRALMFGAVEAFVCHDCATYWLTPTSNKTDAAAAGGRGKCWWTSEFLVQTIAGEPIGTRPATVYIQVMTVAPHT
ncbi:hypothetical protein [Pseudonocardia sp. Ae707_Ps2]|uniref:hypothetical protein n=1 Tax=Pseudonocardia sp. Ae707_Ps2 TaxID=2212992 RepID=UPI00307DD71B